MPMAGVDCGLFCLLFNTLQDADKGHIQMRDLPLEIVDLRS